MRLLILGVLLAPCLASAQVYKCVAPDGSVSFAQAPCADSDGVSSTYKVHPANSIASTPVVMQETGARRGVGRQPEAVDAEYEKKIQFQIKALTSAFAKSGSPLYQEAASLLSNAPRNRDGLILAQDAVSAADRGKPHEALQAARRAAMLSDQGRQNLQEESSQGVAPRTETLNRGAINPQTGKHYVPAGNGVIDPETGKFFPRSGRGFIDPETGTYMPGI